MKFRRYISAVVALAGILACSRMDNYAESGNEIKFATSYVTPDTKGTIFDSNSSLASFTVSAFNNDADAPDDHAQIMNNVVVTNNSGTWGYEGKYLWREPYGKQFFAWANKPADDIASVSATYQEQTLTYTAVPVNAADQKDIMLGCYAGDGGDSRIATISFQHPLSCITFKTGSLEDVTLVKAVRIKDVYNSGKVSQTGDGTIGSWSETSATQTVKQEGLSVAVPSTGSASIGVPFILIPQTATSLEIELDAIVDGVNKTLKGTLTDVNWEAGTAMSYKIDYSGGPKLNFTATVVDWINKTPEAMDMEEKTQQPDDEIWYTTSDGNIMQMSSSTQTDNKYFGAKLVSNTYSGGKGILKFDGAVTKIGNGAFSSIKNFKEIHLPSNVEKFESCSFTFLSGTSPAVIHIPDGFKEFEQGSFYHIDGGDIRQFRIVTSTHEYLLISIDWSYLRLEPNGETSFIVMPQNITFDNGIACCFAKGILITLADGSQKKVEDLAYSDKLKVWNFDEGEDDSANILWITKAGLKAEYFFRCTLSDGTVLDLIGEEDEGTHRLFNKTAGKFEYPDQMAPGSKVYTEHGLVTVVSFERVDEEVEFYNLITDRHINCYINNVLSSCRYNNLHPIDENMKFIKDGRKKRPYKEFKAAGISREWYVGLRLGEQTYDVEDVASYIGRCEINMAEKPAPSLWQRIKTWWKSIFC